MTKKKIIRKAIATHFAKHVQLEKLVRDEIAACEMLRSLTTDSIRSRKRNEPLFIENIGAVEIFSMAEAEFNHNRASEIYGDDRAKYAKGLLTEIAKNGNRKNLAGPPPNHLLQDLRRDFPNFSEAIDQIECAAALSRMAGKDWFQMQPILLLGNAGVGKTAFAQAFADILGVYFKRLDVGTMSTAAMLTGLSLGWGSGHTGEVLKTITSAPTANPLLMLDEIDKSSGHYMSPIEPTLLSLLEKESAASFRDEALLLRVNCKHILWIATANSLENLSEPLRSRFNIVYVKSPSREHVPQVISSIYRKILSANPWGHRFAAQLEDRVIERLMTYSPREARNLLLLALGKAAVQGRTAIDPNDIPARDNGKSTVRMGFL
jgi:ATP-dependent Lon protease